MSQADNNTATAFNSLALKPELLETLTTIGFESMTPIQAKSLPAILNGEDVIGQGKTGSGKTAAFGLGLLNKLDVKRFRIQALVMCPTRELADQVAADLRTLARGIHNIKILTLCGGVPMGPQIGSLEHGAHIIVGTPGRIIDHLDRGRLDLENVNLLVLDEADRMLSMGFKDEMGRIISMLPAMRQNLLFSATLNEDVTKIKDLLLNNPEVIKIEEDGDKVELIEQSAYYVEEEKKGPLLRYLIKSKEMKQVLVFVSSTFKADSVVTKLSNNGIKATAMHGKKTQGARNKALERFKTGQTEVLVATDLLARGIDIDFLPFVVNYELPRSPKDYIHRIGRTGRAELPGEAISLVSPDEEHHFKVIQKKMGKWVDRIDGNKINLHGF